MFSWEHQYLTRSLERTISLASVTYIEDITRRHEDMNFIFEW